MRDTPLRQCPTLEGDHHPLIAHAIAPAQCLARQRDFYHKCHRCRYRGQPAGLTLEDEALPGDRNGSIDVGWTIPAGRVPDPG